MNTIPYSLTKSGWWIELDLSAKPTSDRSVKDEYNAIRIGDISTLRSPRFQGQS